MDDDYSEAPMAANTRRVEFWTYTYGFPKTTAVAAQRAEEAGWDGLRVPDSQNLTGDPYVALCVAAGVTSRLLLGTGVTNPVTRHPAVTACAIASVNEESDGRAVLGIGRGDSALAFLGLAPAPVPVFAHYLERVQGYLRGDDVAFEAEADGRGDVASVEALGLAGSPEAARLRWTRYGTQGKVPVHVYASGERVIRASAVIADGLIFAIGADTNRLRWAIETARSARSEAGLDPEALQFGAMIPVAVDTDRRHARDLIARTLATYIRFSVMHGQITGPLAEAQRQTMTDIHKAYDMNKHARKGPQADVLTDEVIDTFAIAGPVSYCHERLSAIVELGISKMVINDGEPANSKPGGYSASQELFATEIMPALRK